MLSCNIGTYLIKRQSERHIIKFKKKKKKKPKTNPNNNILLQEKFQSNKIHI